MFNTGMQVRFSDTPLWINEGIAMYFEVPDLSSKQGWRKIGQVNFLRMRPVLEYFSPTSSRFLASDDQLRSTVSVTSRAYDMYAQAWAFNYFLLNEHTEKYVGYLKFMAEKPRLLYDSPEQRLADFQEHFDVDLDQLDRQFIKYIRNLGR